jgi:hypothetical protein
VSSLLVEDLRPAHLHKIIAARMRCEKLKHIQSQLQIIVEKVNASRTRFRDRHRKPHNRAARKDTQLNLMSEREFPSLSVDPTPMSAPQKVSSLVCVRVPNGPLNFAAALAKEVYALPLVLPAHSPLSAPSAALPVAEQRALVNTYVRALVPHVAPAQHSPMVVKYSLPRTKVGAFRRLWALYSHQFKLVHPNLSLHQFQNQHNKCYFAQSPIPIFPLRGSSRVWRGTTLKLLPQRMRPFSLCSRLLLLLRICVISLKSQLLRPCLLHLTL